MSTEPTHNLRFATNLLWAGVSLSLSIGVGIFVFTGLNWPKIGVASSAAIAAGAIGGVTGFLFGIPKARSDVNSAGTNAGGQFKPNTNLEQISDWLTKTIVGVG